MCICSTEETKCIKSFHCVYSFIIISKLLYSGALVAQHVHIDGFGICKCKRYSGKICDVCYLGFLKFRLKFTVAYKSFSGYHNCIGWIVGTLYSS